MTLKQYIWDNPHYLGHQLGYTDLNEWHSNQIHRLYRDNPGECGVQAHRNSFKTSAIQIVGPIWKLLYWPDHSILIMREEMKNASAVISAISDKYKTVAMKAIYEELWGVPDFALVRDTQTSLVLPTRGEYTGIEGNIDAAGLKTSTTGRHYNHISPDDIITVNDRISRAKREKTADVIRELRNIIKAGGTIGHSGTPWRKGDGWDLIPNVEKYPIGTVHIESIMKDLPAAIAKFKAGTTRSLYAANYELKHIDDESKLFPENNNRCEWNYDAFKPIAHIDCKYKGKDTMALTLLFRYNNIIHGKGWLFTKNIVDCYKDIVDILLRHKAGALHLEDNGDKGLAAAEFNRGDKKTKRLPYPTVSYHEATNKHHKILQYGYVMWPKVQWDHQTDPEYLNQIMDYVEGEDPDDAADSFSSCARILGGDEDDFLSYYNQ